MPNLDIKKLSEIEAIKYENKNSFKMLYHNRKNSNCPYVIAKTDNTSAHNSTQITIEK